MILYLYMHIKSPMLPVVFVLVFMAAPPLFSQVEPVVERSRITETIGGEEYYLHFIKEGETLFSIARVYATTVHDIFRDNPDAKDGVRSGMILKIPVEKKTISEPVVTAQPGNDFFYHIVKKQETLFSISVKYGVTVQGIREINPEMGEYLKEGETIKIPRIKETTKAPDTPTGEVTLHNIEAGETLYSIARKYNIPTGAILNANPGVTPENLAIGQKLVIPQPETMTDETEVIDGSQGQFKEHIVARGETLYSISKRYGVVIDSLKKYNTGLEFSLYVGQKIKIPVDHQNAEFIVYTPDKPEKLDKIAEKHQIEPEEISELNPEIGRRARKGQDIRIPTDYTGEKEEDVESTDAAIDLPESPCVDREVSPDQTFNVALMVPLFLEAADSIFSVEPGDYSRLTNLSSFRFLNFYSGFLMAVDSMKKQGLNINLFVYDVDNSDQKVNAVLNKSELSSMDLIAGPLYARSFARVAAYAKTFKIPIINPLSTREEVIQDNPYVFKLKPSEDVQTDLLLEHILEVYNNSNVIIVRHNQYQFQSPASYIRNILNTRRPEKTGVSNREIIQLMSPRDKRNIFTENKVIDYEIVNRSPSDSTYFSNYVKEAIYVKDSILGLKMSLSKVRHNLVIAFSDDIVFSKEILSQLNKLSQTHDITLFGIPDWHAYADLETNHLLNLKLHSFSSSVVNYNHPNTKKWIEHYRQQYNIEPSSGNFAFDGFDAGWYFLNALYRFGKDFYYCLDGFSIPLIQNSFRFEHESPHGYRNVYWNLGKFENYQFNKVKLY
ncbi:MAG: LysM peptidoglycan-binding domain-containing protein [Bacteroidales bacterium]